MRRAATNPVVNRPNLAPGGAKGHVPIMTRPTLDDPAYAAFAWARYRRLMVWMGLVSLVTVVMALAWLRSQGPVPIHMMIATCLGVGLSVLLASALMGLVFLSSGTHHDEEADGFVDVPDEHRHD